MKGGCDCKETLHYTHTLMVQKPKTTPGADGRVDLTDDANWSNVGRVRVRFITRGGRESHIFKQIEATVDAVLMAAPNQHALDLTMHPDRRLTFRDRGYDRVLNVVAAQSVNEIGREVRINVTERKQAS